MRACTFDELIRFRAPEGLFEAVTRAAREQSLTASEWLRRAAVDRLKEAPHSSIAAE